MSPFVKSEVKAGLAAIPAFKLPPCVIVEWSAFPPCLQRGPADWKLVLSRQREGCLL